MQIIKILSVCSWTISFRVWSYRLTASSSRRHTTFGHKTPQLDSSRAGRWKLAPLSVYNQTNSPSSFSTWKLAPLSPTGGTAAQNLHSGGHTAAGWRPMKLTRYIHENEEHALPWLRAKERLVQFRVDGQKRLSNPFEHACGGNQILNESFGNDGLSNFISFSNAEDFPEVADDCKQNWDKGQRRVKITINMGGDIAVRQERNKAIDMSDYQKALKWCYEGGTLKTWQGRTLRFEGARTIKPWPYKCAKSVYQTEMQTYSGAPPPSWWTYDNRKKIARKCAQWASLSHEVLVLPDPDRILRGIFKNAVQVQADRPRARNLCMAYLEDKCVSFDRYSNTVCCCSDAACGDKCPYGPGI